MNLSQNDVAEELQLSQRDISKIEKEKDYGLPHRIDFLTIIQLALLYKKPLTYFAPKYLKGRLKNLEEVSWVQWRRNRAKRRIANDDTE